MLPGLREDDCLTMVQPPEMADALPLLSAESGSGAQASWVETLDAAATVEHRPNSAASAIPPATASWAGPTHCVANPFQTGCRWHGDGVILTDALTCSASEDFMLGLHGLPHISTAGEPSCGGSGRPRSVLLTHDLRLSISTALTYDRDGRCVEGNGMPVDLPGPAFDGDNQLSNDALVALVTR